MKIKIKDLKAGMILLVDYSGIPTGVEDEVRPMVAYIVMELPEAGKVAIAFNGNCNCERYPSGWYDLNIGDDYLSDNVVAVYKPRWFGNTFRGDFDNEEEYECIYSIKEGK